MKAVLRYISYLFHGLLALFLLAVGGIALATGPASLRLDALPWTGATLTYVVFFGSLAGLLIIALAVLGKLRWLFVIWALAVLVLMVKGYVFSGYHFGRGGLTVASSLTAGAVISLFGAWYGVAARPPQKKRY